jgi:hypothetical protein
VHKLIAGGMMALMALPSPIARSDSDFDILDINDGELRFLTEVPPKPPHLHQTRVVITADSLQTGWVQAKQCHYNLDRVSALQVVFRAGRTRNLRILRAEQVGKAWVEGASVQLENVGIDAVLCIASEQLALARSADGNLVWRGGPYQRRFLDGYFPMQVQLTVDYPDSLIKFAALEPAALSLRTVHHPGYLRIEALFEGRLDIELKFQSTTATPGLGW